MDSSDIGVGKKAPTGRFSKRLTIRFTAAIVIAVGTGALYRYASILSSLRVADEELLVQPPQTLEHQTTLSLRVSEEVRSL